MFKFLFKVTETPHPRFKDETIVTEKLRVGRVVGTVFGALATIVIIFSGLYVVPEGHVAIEKRFGKATVQTDAGLNFKIPIIETREIIEVRERKNVEKLAAATGNQLPITAEVSINWTVNKDAARSLFIEYGGLEQFENRVLDPKFRSATKAALSQFPADQLIRNRTVAVAKIMEEMLKVTEGLPITINSPQLENIELPPTYMEAVLAKEQAREAAEREKHNLVRQKLTAQQTVQTAEADRDALKARADGQAYRVLIEAKSEAEAIELINEQLTKSPNYVELVKAKAWNGVLPQTMLSDGANLLMSVK